MTVPVFQKIIFVIADNNVLSVYNSEAELQGACEGIDVEDGVYRFFDEMGQPLEPEFYEPNRKGRILGSLCWVVSGKYKLVHSRQKRLVNLKEALASVVVLERNSLFSSLGEVERFLANHPSMS